jgi:hypothetical protein
MLCLAEVRRKLGLAGYFCVSLATSARLARSVAFHGYSTVLLAPGLGIR